MRKRIYKDALTGRFIRPDIAQARPTTTYSINGSYKQSGFRDLTTGRFVGPVHSMNSIPGKIKYEVWEH